MRLALLAILVCFSSAPVSAQNIDSIFMHKHYDKFEYTIPTRDGIKLYTLVYVPKDKSRKYGILLNRTPYNASSYENYKTGGHPSKYLIQAGYILAFQDVRGRYMSEGKFTTMTPNIPGNNVSDKNAIDESSDTWDSIDWMIKNIENNNGNVGILGISYPGFYSAAALADAHPALKAASPQAPISDFFFDDFHHNGAFLQSYLGAYALFGHQKKTQTKQSWFSTEMGRLLTLPVKDAYDFYLKKGPLKNIGTEYMQNDYFWQEVITHPNYDTFWQKRNLLPHLKNIHTAVMTVGGWFDAEDLYGPLRIYKTIEKTSPQSKNTIVMGPWSHGGWASEKGNTTHNHIYFGDSISTFYQREIEAPFFAHYLKGEGTDKRPEAYMFNTGSKQWQKFAVWPPREANQYKLYFGENGRLSINKPVNERAGFSYFSDPAKPVPYTSDIEGITVTPRKFMSDDQRYASRRPDVLTFETDILQDEITIAGEISARLKVAMTGTDADFVVKLVDVYPQDHEEYKHNPGNITMGGYQQLVRSEVFRGRFRNSFEKPAPFVPNQSTSVNFALQDVLHTFKKGHRLMIQVHSTWFPYIDRNPQKYVPNIYEATEKDFIKSTIRLSGASVIVAGGKAEK